MTGSPAAPAGGFTLVELLVSLAIAGVALAAGFAALATVQDRSLQAREATTNALEGAATRTLLLDWLAGARRQDSALGERFEGRNARDHALASDELVFPTTAATPLGVPITGVRLYLDRDPGTREQGLVAELLGRLGDEPVRMELAPQVTGMTITYLPDIDGGVEWVAAWEGQDALPRAVRIELEGLPDNPLPALLALPLHAAPATLR